MGYYPFLTWIGIVLILGGVFMTKRKPASAAKKAA
jgi:drug/metabolite transporter (DMT)-like permease